MNKGNAQECLNKLCYEILGKDYYKVIIIKDLVEEIRQKIALENRKEEE
ncbi:MAG TPA: hypothetical protein PKK61_07545 [Defluviitaleaceae bacterium]|nr:hypothetical protein [Defluviitaleaceae bacterium]